MTGEPLLSVVLPIYDEEATLEALYARLTAVLGEREPYELVFVDDCSSDRSWEVLGRIAADDPAVRLIKLSRNFGHQLAITAGLAATRGEAIVLMDGDLQDPPELIPTLVEKWREGFDVVYAVREKRDGDTWFKRTTASLFYRLLRRLTQMNIPDDTGDFRLLSRRAADALLAMPERARFLRGMASWIGYRQIGVPYHREARYAGRTKYPLRKMVAFAVDAITSFSTIPLRLVSSLGLLMVVFCFGYLVYTLAVKLGTHQAVPGWTSVVVLLLLIGGIQMLAIGVVGQYVARIFDEAKNRPLYLIDEVVESKRAQALTTEHAAPKMTRLRLRSDAPSRGAKGAHEQDP